MIERQMAPRDFVGESLAGLAGSGDVQRRSSKLKLKLMSEVTPQSVQWLWPGRPAVGKLTMLAGDAGLGKSTLSTDIASRVSTGNAWPDGGRATCGSVVVLSAEDGLADTLRPRLMRLGPTWGASM
jgi:AAA domain